MSKNHKVVWTVAIWVAYLLISIVGVGWMAEGTERQTVIWGSFAVALGFTVILWMFQPVAQRNDSSAL